MFSDSSCLLYHFKQSTHHCIHSSHYFKTDFSLMNEWYKLKLLWFWFANYWLFGSDFLLVLSFPLIGGNYKLGSFPGPLAFRLYKVIQNLSICLGLLKNYYLKAIVHLLVFTIAMTSFIFLWYFLRLSRLNITTRRVKYDGWTHVDY